MRILLILCFLIFPAIALAQWSEPTFTPEMRTTALAADPPPVTGSTFYVNKDNLGGASCSDSYNTTQAQVEATPWCTIGKALATMTAGQATLVRAGTYTESNLSFTNQGTAGNYITLRRYPSETPEINCTGGGWCFTDVSGIPAMVRVVIDGFRMYGASSNAIAFYDSAAPSSRTWIINNTIEAAAVTSNVVQYDQSGSFSILSNNIIKNSGGQGVQVIDLDAPHDAAHDVIIEFNEIFDVGKDQDDAGAIKCIRHYNCIVRYNHIYNNKRDVATAELACWSANCQGIAGIYVDFGEDKANGGRTYIYNNKVHDNDAGIEVFRGDNVTIFNNIVYRNGFDSNKVKGSGAGQFGGFYAKGVNLSGAEADTLDGVEVYYNMSVFNELDGYYITYNTVDIIFRNNIAYNNDRYEFHQDFTTESVTNIDADYDLLFDNNLGGTLIRWQGTNYASLALFQARGGNTMWVHGVEADPKFVGTPP